jgi:putative ABC transport system ATP-binding protein
VPIKISVGEEVRVAIARAFAPDPPVLMADEPTGNLDAENGRIVLDMMLDLRRAHGTTLVLVTHDPALADLADRVIRLRGGKVVTPAPEAAAVLAEVASGNGGAQ